MDVWGGQRIREDVQVSVLEMDGAAITKTRN